MAVAAGADRRPVSALLHSADGRRAGPGNFRPRQEQGLSVVVLGRAAGAARQESLSGKPRRLFRLHLSAAVGGAAGDTELFRQDPALSLPIAAQCRRVVDDRAVRQCDDGIGANAGSVAVRAAGLRHGHLRLRHVRPRAAEFGSAGADAVRLLAVAGPAQLDGGQHVCAGYRDQGVSGRGVALSGLAPAVGGGRQHAGFHRRVSVRCCRRRSAASSATPTN